MSGVDLALLVLAGVATSTLTAVAGLGGGVILLSLMVLCWDPLTAIPLHAAVQLVSNASRTLAQRRHVQWGLLGRYALPLVPAGALGLAVAQALPESALRVAIGVFCLIAVWAPRALRLGARPGAGDPGRRFLWLGAVTGFLGTTIGASGPLVGPFFRDLGLSRHAVVGTFAAAQALGHAVKLGLFAAAGFSFAAHAGPLALLSVGVFAGTALGSLLLDRVDERTFQTLYKVALTAVALRLAVWDPFFAR